MVKGKGVAREVARILGGTQDDAERAVDAVVAAIQHGLLLGRRIRVPGLGVFEAVGEETRLATEDDTRRSSGSQADSGQVGARITVPKKPPAKKAGTKVPGAKVPGAKVPGAKVPGAKVPGAKVPGAKVPGKKVPAKKAARRIATAREGSPKPTPTKVPTPMSEPGRSPGTLDPGAMKNRPTSH